MFILHYNTLTERKNSKKVNFEEFKKIEIEISILTPPIIVEYKDFDDLKSKIRPQNM